MTSPSPAANLTARLAAAARVFAAHLPDPSPPSSPVAEVGPSGHVWCARERLVDDEGKPSEQCSLPAWHRIDCRPGIRQEPFCGCRECRTALYGAGSLDDVDFGFFERTVLVEGVRETPIETHRTTSLTELRKALFDEARQVADTSAMPRLDDEDCHELAVRLLGRFRIEAR